MSEWNRADQLIERTNNSLKRIGVAVLGYFGFRAAKESLIDFNSTVEDSKNQIAGMLALSKKTDLTSELANADSLYASLQRRAATLPGTTAEYVKMAGMLTQPIISAKLSMQDLEDLTVNSVVAAKALGVASDVAARDVDQALRGQFHGVDQLTGKLLAPLGFAGEEGRKKFNDKSAAERAAIVKRALTQPQIKQLAEAQGKTFSGVVSTLKDTIQQFFGKVGLPLFRAIGDEVRRWNGWLSKNQDKVERFAQVLAKGVMAGFRAAVVVAGVLVKGIEFLASHASVLKAILGAIAIVMGIIAVESAIAAAPIYLIVAALAALILVVNDVMDAFLEGKGVTASVARWIADKFKAAAQAVRDAFSRVGDFFASIGRAVRNAFVDALGWIQDKIEYIAEKVEYVLDKIKAAASWLKGKALGAAQAVGLASEPQASIASPPQRVGAVAGPRVYNSTFAPTLNVQTAASDPQAVAMEVRQEIDRHWNTRMRESFAGTGGDEGIG